MEKNLKLFIFLFFSAASVQAGVLTGIDVLEKEEFKLLKDANVALITNQTGVNRRGESTVDLLYEAEKVNLKCVLTPEHGFRGTVAHGKKVQDTLDPKTGVPIFSLYGKTTRPTAEMLAGVDTIVYDIQDIGTRFYTYITTMGQALEEAAKRKLHFVVLDRPNPIRGDIIEGDVLDDEVRRFTGYFSIPIRYGLTVGELSRWYNKTNDINANLTVIKMEKWKRHLWFNQTGLKFVAPSPNIPRLLSAILYPGVGCFEATNVSVGRGTKRPFEIFGAPWINGRKLCAYLRTQNFQGVTFQDIEFTPKRDLYKGQRCQGVRMTVTDRSKVRPVSIFLASFAFLYKNHPQDFKPIWEEIRVVTGSDHLKHVVEGKNSFPTLLSQYGKNLTEFKTQTSPYYLYK